MYTYCGSLGPGAKYFFVKSEKRTPAQCTIVLQPSIQQNFVIMSTRGRVVTSASERANACGPAPSTRKCQSRESSGCSIPMSPFGLSECTWSGEYAGIRCESLK